MKFLIQFKDTQEEAIHTFGVLEEGRIFPTSQQLVDEDDDVFYWLTQDQALAIGSGYDGGDWIVLRCACDECEEYETENEGYQLAQGRTNE
jgi:hypothetical protein